MKKNQLTSKPRTSPLEPRRLQQQLDSNRVDNNNSSNNNNSSSRKISRVWSAIGKRRKAQHLKMSEPNNKEAGKSRGVSDRAHQGRCQRNRKACRSRRRRQWDRNWLSRWKGPCLRIWSPLTRVPSRTKPPTVTRPKAARNLRPTLEVLAWWTMVGVSSHFQPDSLLFYFCYMRYVFQPMIHIL